MFILASGSPRRRELLNQVGAKFRVAISDAAELSGEGHEPFELVRRNAEAKAEAVAIKIAAKVGEGGKLYGGITAAQVAEALAAAGIEVEKRNIDVPEIKALGEYEAKAKFYKGVYATLKVEVVAE